MPIPSLPSSASAPDPDILAALAEASTKEDVRQVISRYDGEAVNHAWRHLSTVQQAALRLVRFTNGRIFHELDNTD